MTHCPGCRSLLFVISCDFLPEETIFPATVHQEMSLSISSLKYQDSGSHRPGYFYTSKISFSHSIVTDTRPQMETRCLLTREGIKERTLECAREGRKNENSDAFPNWHIGQWRLLSWGISHVWFRLFKNFKYRNVSKRDVYRIHVTPYIFNNFARFLPKLGTMPSLDISLTGTLCHYNVGGMMNNVKLYSIMSAPRAPNSFYRKKICQVPDCQTLDGSRNSCLLFLLGVSPNSDRSKLGSADKTVDQDSVTTLTVFLETYFSLMVELQETKILNHEWTQHCSCNVPYSFLFSISHLKCFQQHTILHGAAVAQRVEQVD